MRYCGGMKNWTLRLLLLLASTNCFAQTFGDTEEKFDSIYAQRIQMDDIDGVYIPYDLEDAFAELKRLSPPEELQKFQEAPESLVAEKLHFGLGRWMIYNWGFYEGSRFSHYLRELGLEHPDDMAKCVMICFHRHLNDTPLNLEEQVALYKAQREAERLAREASKKVISEEIRIKKND